MSARQIAFWVLFAVTLGVYLVMVAWSLPAVSDAAVGLAPFDMRPGGYSFDEAKAFLSALSPEGADFYRNVQQRFDLFYPALSAATLFFAIAVLAPKSWGVWRWVAALTAVPGAVGDYLENHAVAGMLALGADGITPGVVARASMWTLVKSSFTTLAMAILLLLLILSGVRKLRVRKQV
jgi:hypothetical protein